MWTTEKTWFDSLLIRLFDGVTLGILGIDNSGKSVLCDFILTQDLKHGVYTSTSTRNEIKIVQIRKDKKTIRLKHIFDVGGQTDLYNLKKSTFTSSDYIIYVLRSDLIINEEKFVSQCSSQQEQEELNEAKRRHRNALAADFEQFKYWRQNIPFWEQKKPSQIIVVGNHFGITDEQDNIDENSVPSFLDKKTKSLYTRNFRKCCEEITSYSDEKVKIKWVAGSLASSELAKQLVLDIIEEV
ncbi:MAG: hypothetical protein DSM106950_43615 [Stigonema ocellatum SAG 48.90 = DSM 106950]|nr:hypothetical protein [Stigonema ocellatum SAG 48.90 = DSM 106950]